MQQRDIANSLPKRTGKLMRVACQAGLFNRYKVKTYTRPDAVVELTVFGSDRPEPCLIAAFRQGRRQGVRGGDVEWLIDDSPLTRRADVVDPQLVIGRLVHRTPCYCSRCVRQDCSWPDK